MNRAAVEIPRGMMGASEVEMRQRVRIREAVRRVEIKRYNAGSWEGLAHRKCSSMTTRERMT